MDPLTQGALGAVAAAALAEKKEARLAIFIGWGAGMLADADIFIRTQDDPLLTIEYHRHFSHSLIFIPLGGLIAAGGYWLYLRRWLGFARIFLFALAGYATAGLLDACTSYGTRLLWPFSDQRIGWDIISIIDPVFTSWLLILIVIILRRKCARLGGVIALAGAIAYLGIGTLQRDRVLEIQAEMAINRGHSEIEHMTVKPTIGNLVLWRSIYKHDGRWYVDAIRAGTSSIKIYPGEAVEPFPLEEFARNLPPQSTLENDLRRFEHFSDGYLARHPHDPQVIGDLRYSFLPNSINPLWGIRVDTANPHQHVQFEGFRILNDQTRAQFFSMVRGND